jgi:hypothetical protein
MRVARVRLSLKALSIGTVLLAGVLAAVTRIPLALRGYAESSRQESLQKDLLVGRLALLEEDRRELAAVLRASPQDKERVRTLERLVQWDILLIRYTRRCITFHSRTKLGNLRAALLFWTPVPREAPPEDDLPPCPIRLF